MKKLALIFGLVICFSVSLNAQVTKVQVETSLQEMNLTMADVTTIYVNNIKVVYTDGSSKYDNEQYSKTSTSGGTYKFSLTDNGLKITLEKNGTIVLVKIVPFIMITHISIARLDDIVTIKLYLVN